MNKAGKYKGSANNKSAGKKTLSKKGGRKKPGRALHPVTRKFREHWDAGLEHIKQGYEFRLINDQQRPPWDKAYEYLQIEMYRLVNELREHWNRNHLEDVFRSCLTTLPRKSFEKYPYIWAFRSARDMGEIKISEDRINRCGYMFNYAYQHGIPPELLIGFLHQVGGVKGIDTQIENRKTERWYKPNMKWKIVIED